MENNLCMVCQRPNSSHHIKSNSKIHIVLYENESVKQCCSCIYLNEITECSIEKEVHNILLIYE